MVVFITSVRHPDTANDYSKCLQLLSDTLYSIKQQTNPDYRIIVVCNEIPAFPKDDNIDFVQVSFEPPFNIHRHEDKGKKILVGFKEAAKYSPEYAMIFDADDFLNVKLVEYVEKHKSPSQGGWFFSDGYTCNGEMTMYNKAYKTDKNELFCERCGTSYILHFDLLYEAARHLVFDGEHLSEADRLIARHLFGNHQQYREYYNNRKLPLVELPFPGAIWRNGTGENNLDRGFIGIPKVLGSSIRQEFGVKKVGMIKCYKSYIFDLFRKCTNKLPK